jgi:uncharacterized repeat protein (TIGR01451 family)
LGIDLVAGANGSIAAPQIVTAPVGAGDVAGTACPGCTVEIFDSPDDEGEGKTYLGSSVAGPSEHFTFTLGASPHHFLTATATDAVSGTSEFSAPFATVFPDLSTSVKLADRQTVSPGQVMTYTLVLSNTGDAEEHDARAIDSLPTQVEWLGQFTYSAGTLQYYSAGGHDYMSWHGPVSLSTPVTITFAVRVKPGVQAGQQFSNSASISYTVGLLAIGPVSVTVDCVVFLPLIER